MKKILVMLLLAFFLAGCSTTEPEGQNAPTFSFSVDPVTGKVSLNESGALARIANEAVLEPGRDLELVQYDYAFLPGNVLNITAVFQVGAGIIKDVGFQRVSSLDSVVSSSEPVIPEDRLGNNGALDESETTGELVFQVTHKGQAFTYEVEALGDILSEGANEMLGYEVGTVDGETSYTLNETVEYEARITNNGDSERTDIYFTAEISPAEAFAYTGDPDICDTQEKSMDSYLLLCVIDAVGPGETLTLPFTATPVRVGEMITLFDLPNAQDSTQVVSVDIVAADSDSGTDLSVSILPPLGTTSNVGEEVSFDVYVYNDGPSTVSSPVLVAEVDIAAGLEYMGSEDDATCTAEASGPETYRLLCDVSSLANGAVTETDAPAGRTLSFTATTSQVGTMTARFELFPVENDPDPANNMTSVDIVVSEALGAECSDPIDIPDQNLRKGIRIQLGLAENAEIICANMEALTEFDLFELRGEIDPQYPEYVEINDLEGLQYATNLELFRIGVFGDPAFFEPIRYLTSLTSLTIVRSFSTYETVDAPSEYENYHDLSMVGNLTNLTSLTISFYHTDFSWITSLTKLTDLDLSHNELLEDLSDLSTLTTLNKLNLTGNIIRDIGPLVANSGLGEGNDEIILYTNCLDLSAGSQALVDIEMIEARNPDVVNVSYTGMPSSDCTP